MGNLRLGYWWDSGVIRKGGWTRRLPFGVQLDLLAEFLAHFRGPHRRDWHLTDGGHFENLGAYELIRRRVKLIVIVDAFPSLANLVRKARIDFQAEIEFLDEEDVWSQFQYRLGHGRTRHFGPLKHLRRGRWEDEPFKDRSRLGERVRQILMHPPERGQLSRAHAALGLIRYDGNEKPGSVLLYLKPTLTGEEPADLSEYHLRHPDFPQESTADQFFDEAQWESYRKLGEHIASEIFGGFEDNDDDLLTRLLASLRNKGA